MSEKQNSKKSRSRTYARNRTKLNRRGFEKSVEKDGVFILKLILSVLAGSFWLKFASGVRLGDVFLAGLPLGLIIGIFIISKFENRSENRKIFYAVILICAILSYFVPSGIVL